MTALLVLCALALLAVLALVAAICGGVMLVAFCLDHPIAAVAIVLLVIWIV